jgi:hypothetical protein
MRTTLEIDDDVLSTAKELARRERSSAGSVLSRLARQALLGGVAATPAARASRSRAVGGFVPFGSRGVVVSNDEVNALRDADGI